MDFWKPRLILLAFIIIGSYILRWAGVHWLIASIISAGAGWFAGDTWARADRKNNR